MRDSYNDDGGGKLIKKELRNIKTEISLQIIMTIIATIAIAMIPAYNKYLADVLIMRKSFHFGYLILLYIITYGTYLFASWCSERFVWKCAIKFENSLKKKCFAKMSGMNYKDYAVKNKGEYLSFLTNQITQIEQDYLQPYTACIKSVISVLIYIVVIAYTTNWLICLVLLLLSFLSGFSPKLYEKKLRDAGREYMEENANYTKKMTDLLSGFELITDESRRGFQNQNNRITDFLSHKRLQFGHRKVNGITFSGTMVCLIDAFVFILCGILFLQGDVTIGVVVAALTYAQAFTEPVEEILYDINTFNSSKDVVKSLEEFFAYQPEETEKAFPKQSIEIRDARVKYADKELIFNICFELKKKYVLCGASGLGKSTLLNIISDRIVYDGEMYIDGQRAKLDEVSFFYLTQNQHVFMESFERNISLFETFEINSTGLAQIFRDVPIYDRIRKAENATLLSGGEQQLLKFCRALVQEKPILLLDEPFSAMDRKTRKQMLDILENSGAMIVLVTHDFCEEDFINWEQIRLEGIIDG